MDRSDVHVLPGKPFHRCQAREKELSEMSSLYKSMNNPHDPEPVLTTLYLTGLPGSGKTELARQFGVQFLKNAQDCENNPSIVLTLSAESTQSLLKSAQSVASKLGLVRKPANAEGIGEVDLARFYLEYLRERLQTYDWLLILDNVRSDEKINSILPQAGSKDWGRCKVLVTSQDHGIVPMYHEYAKRHSLNDGMSKQDASDLLQKVSGVAVDDVSDQLAKELNYLPLSLACAGAYVGTIAGGSPKDFSWNKFLDIYHEEKNEVNYQAFTKFNVVYPYSMAVVAKLAAKRMAELNEILPLTFDFLSHCSLDPVPLPVVSSYVKSCLTANIPLAEIENEIYRCSLLLGDHSGFRQIRTIKFHQVINKAFKSVRDERDFHLSELEMKDRFVDILKSINTSLEPTVWGSATPDDVALQILMSPHLQSFVTYGKSKNWNMSEEFVVMSVNAARCLYHISGVTDNQRAKYLEEARSVAQELELKGIKYCYLLANLGFYFRELHQLEKSEQILKQALSAMPMKCQDSAKEWLSLEAYILKILAWTYKLLQKFDMAVRAMKKSIAVARQAFGEDHEEIVESLCALSFIYRDKYEMEKAKEAVDMARDIALRKTDEFDLKRAEAMCNSGKIYLSCADREDNAAKKEKLLRSSKEFHEKALKIYEKVLGENHISVAGALITYAAVCKELKQVLEAMKHVERAENIYTYNHHEIGLSFALSYKADILLDSGKVEEAECLLSNSVGAKFLLASLYLRKKKFFKAKAMFEKMLAGCKSGKSPPSRQWIDQAGTFMAECDRETSIFLPILLAFGVVCVLLISVFLAYCGMIE